MKVGYYIAQRLNELGVTEVYGLVGGSTSGINDGFFRCPGINFVPFHHEQGAGHAAVGSMMGGGGSHSGGGGGGHSAQNEGSYPPEEYK